jgi:tetratricopeptide (TPR) repeat protein
LALIRHSLTVALDNDVSVSAQRAYFNLSNLLYYRDEYDEALRYADAGLALSRRFGERDWEWQFLANTVAIHYWIGRWDDALTTAEDIPRLEEIPAARFASVELLLALPPLFIARGQIAEARKVVDSFEAFAGSADEQERSSYFAGLGIVLRGEGNTEEALEVCEKVVFEPGLGESFAGRKLAVAEAFDAAVTLGAWKRAETLRAFLQNLPAGASPPYNPAQMARFDAIIKAHEGSPETENSFKRAVGAFREIQTPFRLGVTILEYAEWLAEAGRPDEASVLIDEADGIFTRLSAEPWVKRAAGVLSGWHSPMSSSSG